MSYIQLVKSSFRQFDQLKAAKNLALGKIAGHLILLSLIFAIPISIHVLNLFSSIQLDGKEIAKKIPDFTIQNDQLTLEKPQEGFIYQTDSIIFTFDPEGKRDPEAISSDLVGNFLSVGLLKDQVILSFPATENVTTILGSNQLKIPYTNPQIQQLTGEKLRDSINQNQLPWWLLPLIFLVALYPSFITIGFSLLLTTLFANLFGRFRGLRQTFLENFKIVVMASTMPVLIAVLVNTLVPNFATDTFLMIGSLFIFNLATRMPSKQPK